MRPFASRPSGGFTLMESLLALALGVMVLLPLATAFQISAQGWQQAYEEDELLNHARIAMSRMVADLRYAVTVNFVVSTGSNVNLTFTTRTRENNDWSVEYIKYTWVSGEPLKRQINSETAPIALAGLDPPGTIVVNAFAVTAYKKVGGNLVALNLLGGDTLSMTVAVQIDLTMQDTASSRTVTLTSLAKMRNI